MNKRPNYNAEIAIRFFQQVFYNIILYTNKVILLLYFGLVRSKDFFDTQLGLAVIEDDDIIRFTTG